MELTQLVFFISLVCFSTAFATIFLVGGYGFIKTLKADYDLMHVVQNHNTVVQYSQASTDWKERLDALITHPAKDEAKKFLKDTAQPAFNDLRDELADKDLKIKWPIKKPILSKRDSTSKFL